ncbi:MAG: glycosyltransferase family 2 protein [Planctomycetota bacterium]
MNDHGATEPEPGAAAGDDLLLSVVIPVYNEIATLQTIVDRVRQVPIRKEIILVDDGSVDGSRDLIDELATAHPNQVRGFKHERNKGKGAALKTGFAQALGDVIIIQDADLEYDPDDYLRMVKPVREARADVVYGSRFLVGEYARVHLFWHYMGNRFLTFVSNMFTGLNLTDMETCYKLFRRELVQDIEIRSKRFTIEVELTAKFAKKRLRIFEVPIRYAGRNYGEGKKITWRDGFAALWAIARFRFAD